LASKSRVILLLKSTVSIGLLAVLFAQTDASSLYTAMRRASLPWLVAALALYLAMILASAWRWNLLLAAQRISVSGWTLVSSFLVATFFNSFLPSNIGGDVIRIRDTTQPAGSIGRATAIVVIDRAMGLLGLLLVAAVSGSLAVIGMAGPALPVSLPWLWLAFATATGGFLILLLAPQTILTVLGYVRFLHRDAIVTRVRKLVDMMLAFRAQPLALVSCFAGALVAQAVLVAFYVAIARSLEIPISPLHLAVVVPMSFVVQLLPVSVNGFGVREATFTYYFAALHLPIESALVLSVVGAGLVLLFSLSGGVLYVARR
jgi:glycosyltransferase 2 family protein